MLVPTGVLIAGVLLGAWWLAAVALVTWVALALHTFFDERAAERVGARVHAGARAAKKPSSSPGEFTPLIAGRVKAAVGARAAIHEAIDGRAVRVLRRRGTRSTRWSRRWRPTRCARSGSGSSSPGRSRPRRWSAGSRPRRTPPVRAALESKQRAFGRLRERLSGLMAEMDQVVATLQTVQAEIFAADELSRSRRSPARCRSCASASQLVGGGPRGGVRRDARAAGLTPLSAPRAPSARAACAT